MDNSIHRDFRDCDQSEFGRARSERVSIQSNKMGVPRTRVERIASEDVAITADTALRLSKALGTTPQLWLNLQNDYDLQIAHREIGKKLAKIEPVIAHAAG